MGIAPQGLEVAALRRLGTSPGGEGSTELPGDLGIKAALLAQNGTGSGMLFVPRSSTWGQAEGLPRGDHTLVYLPHPFSRGWCSILQDWLPVSDLASLGADPRPKIITRGGL